LLTKDLSKYPKTTTVLVKSTEMLRSISSIGYRNRNGKLDLYPLKAMLSAFSKRRRIGKMRKLKESKNCILNNSVTKYLPISLGISNTNNHQYLILSYNSPQNKKQ
jgi:hypothetical protein